jgi:hypothetical protein
MVGVGNVPDNLARVTFSPADLNGNSRAGAGGTQNFRFRDNQRVTVEAPAEHNGKPFRRWRIQAGSEPVFRTQRRVTVTLDKGNYLFISEYGDGNASAPSPMVPFAGALPGIGGTGNAAADAALGLLGGLATQAPREGGAEDGNTPKARKVSPGQKTPDGRRSPTAQKTPKSRAVDGSSTAQGTNAATESRLAPSPVAPARTAKPTPRPKKQLTEYERNLKSLLRNRPDLQRQHGVAD